MMRRAVSGALAMLIAATCMLCACSGDSDGHRRVPTPADVSDKTITSPYDWDCLVWMGNDRLAYIVDGEERSRVGIDVSEHQGSIDWQAVAEDGISFFSAGIAVAVAVDDDVCLVIRRDVALDVGHADPAPEEVEIEDQGQIRCPVSTVVVAPHDVEGLQLFQAVQDVRLGDVACMDDELAGVYELDDLRPEKIMRIGNDSDAVHFFLLIEPLKNHEKPLSSQ